MRLRPVRRPHRAGEHAQRTSSHEQVYQVAGPEFCHHVLFVHLHRHVLQAKTLGDLPVLLALQQQGEDVALTWREAGVARLDRLACAALLVLHGGAGHGLANGSQQLRLLDRLGQEALGAGLHRPYRHRS